jgi:cephalosporin-C deacetylase-like acetyl esterase
VPFEAWKATYGMWTNKYTDSFNVEFDTEENVRVTGQLFVPRDGKPTHPALIYVKGAQDIIYPVDYDLVLSALTTHVVLILSPRAVDYPMDNYRAANTKMTIALLGATIESMQVWDIQRSVDYLFDQEKLALSGISVYGRKQMGALALTPPRSISASPG